MDSKYNFKELMTQRHSTRKFQSKEIPKDVLKDIISTSLLTPSWTNSQPWKIYVASGKPLDEVKKEWLSKFNNKVTGYPDIPVAHRNEFREISQKNMGDLIKTFKEFSKADIMDFNYIMFNAPTVIYLTLAKGNSKWSVYDMGALSMSIMLAAKDRGIDSIPATSVVLFPDVLRKILKIPETEDIIVGIALGYEEKCVANDYRASKLKLEDVCTFIE
jgi:nitroreductase